MAGWNMTGVSNPHEDKANKAIRAAQELAFESHPFEGKVNKWDVSKQNSLGTTFESIMDSQKEGHERSNGMRR